MRMGRASRWILGVGEAALLLALFGLGRAAAQAPDPAGPAEMGEEFPPVLSTDWLEMQLRTEGLGILDARPSLLAFAERHIPGAQHLTCDNLRSSAGGTPGKIFPIELIEAIAGRLGFDRYTRVVVYSDASDEHAAFVATVLRGAGMQRVSILDGGLARWAAEGRPLTRRLVRVEPTAVRLTPTIRTLANIEEVRRAVESGEALLLDVRPREMYDAGHIPGAAHRFWQEDFEPPAPDGPGTFRPAAEVDEEYRALGVARDRLTIVYANTAHSAAAVFWTLRHRLGYAKTRLYDGSWLEWSGVPGAAREPESEDLDGDLPAAALQRARAAATSLATGLMSHLIRELRTGGPAQALGVCFEIAPTVAAEHSIDGITVRRVSNQVRNTADTPDSYERVALRDLQWLHEHGRLPEETAEVVRADGARVLRYLRPILVKEICLQCHGAPERIDPEVREFIEERYPEDQAIGYQVGDLRGAISVTVELEE